ncbi:hypothetical protein REPUB_Repub14bG0061800 [Reevesia pubescens]
MPLSRRGNEDQLIWNDSLLGGSQLGWHMWYYASFLVGRLINEFSKAVWMVLYPWVVSFVENQNRGDGFWGEWFKEVDDRQEEDVCFNAPRFLWINTRSCYFVIHVRCHGDWLKLLKAVLEKIRLYYIAG